MNLWEARRQLIVTISKNGKALKTYFKVLFRDCERLVAKTHFAVDDLGQQRYRAII